MVVERDPEPLVPSAALEGAGLVEFAIVSEYNYHRRERCGALRLVEVEPTPDEAELTCLPVDMVMKPTGIGPRGK